MIQYQCEKNCKYPRDMQNYNIFFEYFLFLIDVDEFDHLYIKNFL